MKTLTSQSGTEGNAVLLKGLAGLQLLAVIIGYVASGETWTRASTLIALSLAIILFSRERINDERVVQLKLRAISYGLFSGLIVATAFDYRFTRLRLSTFDGLIIILVIALALFNYWRWEDGRAVRTDD